MIQTTLTMKRPMLESAGFSTRVDAPAVAHPSGPLDDLAGLTPFLLADRLAQVWSRNARRLEDLDRLRDKIDAARRRLSSSSSGRALGEAYLRRLIEKKDACLASIRSDRRAAVGLVRECERRQALSNHSPLRRAVGV